MQQTFQNIGNGFLKRLQQLKQFWHTRKQFRWVTYGFLGLCLLAFGAGFAFVLMVYSGFFGALPTAEELQSLETAEASEVYDENGKLLGKYYLQERTNVRFQELPQHLVDALIATEDARFYAHNGIDYRSLLRVLFRSILLGDESGGGGSTLSQQLAKNLYPRQSYGLLSMPVNKVREMLVAQRLESIYSKQEILTLYLNTVSFGSGAFGIETASGRFFSKPPQKLTVPEAAVLVGMLKATSYYNPKLHPERAEQRRNTVLSQMAKYGKLSAGRADTLSASPISLDYNKKMTHNEGSATYFREYLRLELLGLIDAYNQQHGTDYNIYTDGLRIHTTINYAQQSYAEQAMYEHLKQLQSLFDRHWQNRDLWKGQQTILKQRVQQTEHYQKLKKSNYPKGPSASGWPNRKMHRCSVGQANRSGKSAHWTPSNTTFPFCRAGCSLCNQKQVP